MSFSELHEIRWDNVDFKSVDDCAKKSGWNSELENLSDIDTLVIEGDRWLRALPGTYSFPSSLNDLSWHKVEQQGRLGSCQGVSGSSVAEGLWWLASGGQSISLSGWAHYRLSQMQDGIRGDRGSTLAGGRKVAMELGFVPKDMCPPYPPSYGQGWRISQEMKEAAVRYRVKSVVRLRTYDDCFRFLTAGNGFVHVGSRWTRGLGSSGKVIERFRSPQDGGRHGGGHAYFYGGWTARKDQRDRNYLVLVNSWGENVGDEGAYEIAPVAVSETLSDNGSVAFGYSDMTIPGPRSIPWDANDHV